MTHTLVVIGIPGVKTAYLDIPREEAIRRYCEREGYHRDDLAATGMVEEFTFTDAFHVYDAWQLPKEEEDR